MRWPQLVAAKAEAANTEAPTAAVEPSAAVVVAAAAEAKSEIEIPVAHL